MSGPHARRDKTTLAIALSQGAESSSEFSNVSTTRASATRVSATGRGAVAEQIIAIALDHGVKLREDADLAEVLAALDVDSPISLGALSTVAGILTYVYRAKGHADNPAHSTLEGAR